MYIVNNAYQLGNAKKENKVLYFMNLALSYRRSNKVFIQQNNEFGSTSKCMTGNTADNRDSANNIQ